MQEIVRLAQRVKTVASQSPEQILERTWDKIYTTTLTPFKKLTLGKQSFRALGQKHTYAADYYNATWRNERAVEVPLLRAFLQANRGRRILELGNVSAYYTKQNLPQIVVDKYERSNSVHNIDVLDAPPSLQCEGILSISTLEHIGWDESVKDPLKTLRALIHLYDLVSDKSNVLFTFPTGHNPYLDKLLAANVLPFVSYEFMERVDSSNHWAQCDRSTVLQKRYGSPYYAANGLVIGRGLRAFDENELNRLKI